MTILVIHQSAELYGSDKTLLHLVSALQGSEISFIIVLPFDGPLRPELEKCGAKVIIAPVIKISRKMFTPGNVFSLPTQVWRGFAAVKKQLGKTKIDLVYSNTLAVMFGALYAKRFRLPHLWHVHEIIEHPKIIARSYPKLVRRFSNVAVFNSFATQDFMLSQLPALSKISQVVHNGIDRPEPKDNRDEVRSRFFDADKDSVVIALVGRISRWKGQKLLAEAFSKMKSSAATKLVFVGSAPPGQDHFERELQQTVSHFGLTDKTKMVAFTDDIWSIWDAIDIAVVPSTEPEPFGLVAIEAMLAKKPVVGANHGGLVEIIRESETGNLFTPGNASELAECLDALSDSLELRKTFGNKGFEIATEHFSQKSYTDAFLEIFSRFSRK
ncbi:glycosyltransferase family 4 protein [Flavobacterium sp.]|uniref:glycosyltransferase family 4 protein n=1 Tax=Flavobacterium sp. TaxID=239 RepID=UPI00121F7C9B|nr:glycosyltransferase family 4 protein [Flavobacterium sp.]RZJ71972.1 MAG: glycosyltransferase family 1 protein [Flavobacterium sp.]